MKKIYVLDACALIAAVNNEDGAIIIAELYEEAEADAINLVVNKVNLFEIYYNFHREKGKDYADVILKSITNSNIEISDISMDVLTEAGRIKSEYRRISLADAIVLAEASTRGGYLVTADHHELDIIEKHEKINFLWIR